MPIYKARIYRAPKTKNWVVQWWNPFDREWDFTVFPKWQPALDFGIAKYWVG